MKKMTTTLSALTIAAALMMNLTACTTDDVIKEEAVQPTSKQGIHITVGAGLGDGDGTTRAAVTQEGTTRTLTFTEGDRLYVTGTLTNNTKARLAGYLTIDAKSISTNGKSASFSGDLQVWDKDGNDITENFTFGANQLDNYTYMSANLVPKDAPDGLLSLNIDHSVLRMNYAKSIAADVNTLMKTAIEVSGDYNGTTKAFMLSPYTAILNCAIGHLKKNNNYSVMLCSAATQNDYESNNFEKVTYDGTVTTDNNGVACFAIGLEENENRYYVLKVKKSSGSTTTEYVLGQKDLDAKVYNVKKDNHALGKFTVQMPQAPGYSYYEECNYFTVTDDKGHTYSTQGNGLLTFMDGQTNFQFNMEPVTNATLTITGINTSGDTYVGTIENVTLEEFGTYNFGPVTMRKVKDLSAGSVTAANGDVIIQSSNESTSNTITIPDGVTVTIEDVNISKDGSAGIICQGSANIILSGSNSVRSGNEYPAVQAGPTGTTLTISGSGSLTATGGSEAAGIGCGKGGKCGDITITGGNITAKGGERAAGIGCGVNGYCSTITINGGTGSATKGEGAPYSVGGATGGSSCYSIYIGSVNIGNNGIVESPFMWQIP
jgi:hypothetical protein